MLEEDKRLKVENAEAEEAPVFFKLVVLEGETVVGRKALVNSLFSFSAVSRLSPGGCIEQSRLGPVQIPSPPYPQPASF